MLSFKPCLIDNLAFPMTEEDSFEKAFNEYEVEGYLKGFDIEEIKAKARSHEGQEQWGIFVPKTKENASSGSMRVRKVTNMEGEISYEFTTKLAGDSKGRPEVDLPTNEDQFELFKHLADQGLIKMRYNIDAQVNGVPFIFQVDVFYTQSGELVPWVKIDAELPEGMQLKPEDFPFVYDEILVIDPKTKQDNPGGINDKIKDLYETYFRSKNQYVGENNAA